MSGLRELRAGPLSLCYQGDELRNIRIGDEVVLDRLYFALRDNDWLTLPLALDAPVVNETPDGFTVSITGSTDTTAAAFTFSLDFVGSPHSLVARVRYTAVGSATISRIGFCLLHPMDFAGSAVVVAGEGEPAQQFFPSEIAPWSPFTNFHGLTLRAGSVDVDFLFEGDAFDMEDQRNWIDASFKTFAPPQSIPIPRLLRDGEQGEQKVTLRWTDAAVARTSPRTMTAGPTTIPPVGLGASRGLIPLSGAEAQLIRALDPAWLAVTLMLDGDWVPRWNRAVAEANLIGVGLDVSLVASDATLVAAWGEGEGIHGSRARVVRLQAYDLATHVTTAPLAVALRQVRASVGGFAGASIAGGARSNFAELSRSRADVPLGLLDEVAFAANPQVHAFDDDSIMTTPRALAAAVHAARQIAGELPLIVGPLTFTRTFNAVAADPGEQIELPPDPRQHLQVAADWVVAAIDASRWSAGVTVYETKGEWGVLSALGAPSPSYEILRHRAAPLTTRLPPTV